MTMGEEVRVSQDFQNYRADGGVGEKDRVCRS